MEVVYVLQGTKVISKTNLNIMHITIFYLDML